ncbi:MAG: hypothetical protein P4L51_19185 [Puia sp.]|nr:hypothetical protein [Puia sp.]
MKPFLIFLLVLSAAAPSCRKFIQQQEQKAALNIITNGVWVVNSYQANDTDVTASFAGYVFQFKSDGTVTGTRNDSSTQGVWSANISTRQIISSFPANAPAPLGRLDASWTITDSGDTYVKASSPESSDSSLTNKLWLVKQ